MEACSAGMRSPSRSARTKVTPLPAGTGRTAEVQFRGIRPGEQTVIAPVAGCTAAPGCRLVSIQLVVPFVDDFVPHVDAEKNTVVVRPIHLED